MTLATPPTINPSRVPRVTSRAGRARLSGDWAWGGLGIGAATASAGFAAYMVVLSPPEAASGDFRVFAAFDHRAQPSSGGQPNASMASVAGPVRAGTDQAAAIDFAPTGTVAEREQGPGGSDATPRAPLSQRQEEKALPDFTLRDVFDGKALVQSRSSLSVVKPGSVLAGAGAVLSIERRGSTWVVTTERGVIVGSKQ